MTTKQVPPGPARRDALLAAGRNISRRDFTDEEWAEMESASAARAEHRRSHPPTPFPEGDTPEPGFFRPSNTPHPIPPKA